MKLRSLDNPEIFEAKLTSVHPGIPGELALQRTDTGAYISLTAILSSADPYYEVLDSTPAERSRLEEIGVILFGSFCYMDMRQETQEAILADLQVCLEESRHIASTITTIQLNHRRYLPLLGDLRPTRDATTVIEEQIKMMIERVKNRRVLGKELFRKKEQTEQENITMDTMTALRAKIWADIQKHGFFIMQVAGEPGSPPYAYTIGLAPTFPELLIIGVSHQETAIILHRVVNQLKNEGAFFESGHTYTGTGILDELPCYFAQVDRAKYEDSVGGAILWHHNREFPLLQLVWPDPSGRFPWQAGYEERLRADQPLLFQHPHAD
jgi:hypothetical protein